MRVQRLDGTGHGSHSPHPGTLERLLEHALAAGRQHWPQVAPNETALAAYLAERLPRDDESPEMLLAHARDLFLASACLRGDAAAIKAFETDYLRRVQQHLAQVRGLGPAAEDVGQELRELILVGSARAPARLEAYRGIGSLAAWLRVVATRFGVERARRKKRTLVEVALEASHDAWATTADPELAQIKLRYRDAFGAAFRDALAELAAESRTILRLYLVDRLGLDGLAPVLGVSRATAARRIAEVRQGILDGTRRALQRRLHISAQEAASLARLLRSQLDANALREPRI